MAIQSEKELASAIERDENYIEIEGDLGKKVLKIKAAGTVAWAICLGAIAVAMQLKIDMKFIASFLYLVAILLYCLFSEKIFLQYSFSYTGLNYIL